MPDRTPYQDKLIRNYYQNRDAIALQRAQELVTDLFLASGKKRTRCWEQLKPHLAALDISPQTIDHLIEKDDPKLVAEILNKKV
jgi:phosphohistidine phosphatase SixA